MNDITLHEGNNELNIQLTPLAPSMANLYGLVTDIDTGLPIANARIDLDGFTAYSNGNGEYAFEGLTPGAYSGEVTKEGYGRVVI